MKSLNFAGPGLLNNKQASRSVITSTEGSLLPDQLENLVLEEVCKITDYEIQVLNCPTIMLGRGGLGWLTLAGYKGMIESAEKLKKLIVCECGEVHEDTKEAELKDIAERSNIQLELLNW